MAVEPRDIILGQELAINLFRLEVEGLKALGNYRRVDTIEKQTKYKRWCAIIFIVDLIRIKGI
jgi:hypothetical protein